MTTVLAQILGHFMSKYDETAILGISALESALHGDPDFANRFLADRQSVSAFLSLYKRSCDVSSVNEVVPKLLSLASRVNASSFAFTLCNTVSIIQRWKKELDHVTDNRAEVVCSVLKALTCLVPFAAEVMLPRLGGGSLPLHLVIFTKDQLTHKQLPLRLNRTLFLTAFLTYPLKPTLFGSIIRTHGYLIHLLQDCAEILKVDPSEHNQNIVKLILENFRNRFILNDDFAADEKRRLLSSQHVVLKALTKLLAVEHGNIDEVAAETIRSIVSEVREAADDYILHKDEDQSRMPNHLLFTLARMLRPRRRNIDVELLTFVLGQCPDLFRPYIARASQHLTSAGDDEHQQRSLVSQYLAVANTMTRLFLSPIPFHLASGSATLIPLGVAPVTFYQLSPTAVADEVLPSWLGEYFQRLIAQDNLLFTTWALQSTQAAVFRALRVKEIIHHLQARAGEGSHEDELTIADETDAFLSALDRLLQERLPKREEIWHRVTQQLLPNTATASGPAAGSKVQFVLQRCYVLMMGYSELFHLRVPWASAVPSPLGDWTPLSNGYQSVLATWSPDSVGTLCALLLSNLTKNVKLNKMHHITFAAERKQGEMNRCPPLLELLYWYDANRHNSAAVRGLFGVARLVLWLVHSSSTRFAATLPEVTLWLKHLNGKTVPLLLHVLNTMLQQSLSKAADRVAATLASGTHGVLCVATESFIERTNEKFANKKPESFAKDIWQLDLKTHLPALEKTVKRVKEEWATREENFHEIFGGYIHELRKDELLAAQLLGRAQTLRHQKSTSEVASFFHASPFHQLVAAFTGKPIPAPAASEWATIVQSDKPFTALSHGILHPYLFASSEDESNAAAEAVHPNEDPLSLPWLGVPFVCYRLVARYALYESHTSGSTSFAVGFLGKCTKCSVSSFLEMWRTFDHVQQTAVAALLLATIRDVFGSETTEEVVPGRDECITLETLLIGLYSGCTSIIDRALLASLGYLTNSLPKIEPVAPPKPPPRPRSSEGKDGALQQEDTAAGEEALQGLGSSDDDDSSSSGSDDAGGPAAEETAEAEDSLDESETGEVKGGAILLEEEEGEQSNDGLLLPAESGDDKTKRPSYPRKRREPQGDRFFALPSFQRHRFLIGGESTPEKQLPELSALLRIVGSWLEETAVSSALKMPLGLGNVNTSRGANKATNSVLREEGVGDEDGSNNSETTSDEGDATPPTEQQQQKKKDKQGAKKLTSKRHTSLLCDIFTELQDPSQINCVEGSSWTGTTGLDVRYIVPLIFTLCSLRRRRVAFVPAGVLIRCHPVLLRALSCTSGAIVRMAIGALGLIHDLLPPLQRYMSNEARLLLLANPPRSAKRLLAAHSAFLIMGLRIARDVTHPFYPRIINALNSGDRLLSAFPLRELLVAFPTACLSGDPTAEYKTAQQQTTTTGVRFALAETSKAAVIPCPPHLSWILSFTRHSVVTVADYALLERTQTVQTLLSIVTIATEIEHVRPLCFGTLLGILKSHVKVGRRCSKHLRLPQWCCGHIRQLLLSDCSRNVTPEIAPVAAVLEASLLPVGSSMPMREREEIFSDVIGIISFLTQGKLLSTDVLKSFVGALTALLPSGGKGQLLLASIGESERVLLKEVLLCSSDIGGGQILALMA